MKTQTTSSSSIFQNNRILVRGCVENVAIRRTCPLWTRYCENSLKHAYQGVGGLHKTLQPEGRVSIEHNTAKTTNGFADKSKALAHQTFGKTFGSLSAGARCQKFGSQGKVETRLKRPAIQYKHLIDSTCVYTRWQ